MRDNDVTMTIRLPRQMRDAFVEQLAADDMTASQIVRRAIRQYLTGQGPSAPSMPAPVIAPSAGACFDFERAAASSDHEAPAGGPKPDALEGLRAMLGMGAEVAGDN